MNDYSESSTLAKAPAIKKKASSPSRANEPATAAKRQNRVVVGLSLLIVLISSMVMAGSAFMRAVAGAVAERDRLAALAQRIQDGRSVDIAKEFLLSRALSQTSHLDLVIALSWAGVTGALAVFIFLWGAQFGKKFIRVTLNSFAAIILAGFIAAVVVSMHDRLGYEEVISQAQMLEQVIDRG